MLPANRDPSTIYIVEATEKMYIGDVEIGKTDIDAIYNILNNKADSTLATSSTSGLMSSDHYKLCDILSTNAYNANRSNILSFKSYNGVPQSHIDALASYRIPDDLYLGSKYFINGREYLVAGIFVGAEGRVPPKVALIQVNTPSISINDTATTAGGYAGSQYRQYVDDILTPQLDTDFPGMVINSEWSCSNAVTDGKVTGWTNITAKACLPTMHNIGVDIYNPTSYPPELSGNWCDPIGGVLPLARYSRVIRNHYFSWSRDVYDDTRFLRFTVTLTTLGYRYEARPANDSTTNYPIFLITAPELNT